MNTLKTLDYIAIAVFMAMSVGIGIFLGKYVKNIGDYFKGGNTIPWSLAGISNFMTMFSTFIFVAYAGIAYEHGLIALVILWSSIPPALFTAYFLAKRWRRAGISTPVEFLETRFNAPVRQVLSWGGVAFKIVDNMVRLYAIGLFISASTSLSLEFSILFSGLVVVIYTVIGGLWAVVATDVIQFVILIFTTIILLPLSLQAVGGISHLAQSIPDHFTWFNGEKGAPLFILAYYILVLLKYSGNWAFIQRFYSVKDEAAGKKVGLLSAGFFFIFPVLFLLPAIAARTLIPDLDNSEMAYVSICLRLLPEGIMGLMIASMFAATMSTVSAEFNIVASVLTNDIYKRLLKPISSGRHLMVIAKISTAAVGLVVTFGALYVNRFGGAFEVNKVFTGLFAVPMIIPLLFGILFSRPRPWGVFATIIIGIGTGLYMLAHPEISWEVATLIEITACVVTMLVSGAVPSTDKAYLKRVTIFFKKLSTPLTEADKFAISPVFLKALTVLFIIALSCTGVLFMAMSIPSLTDLSGKLAMMAGFSCILVAAALWYVLKQVRFKPTL